MLSTRNITTTGIFGHESGVDFDDIVGNPNINSTAISRIVVTYNTYISSLTVGFHGVFNSFSLTARNKVHYTDKVGVRRGESIANSSDIIIIEGEFVTKVEATFVDSAISRIAFWTNKGM